MDKNLRNDPNLRFKLCPKIMGLVGVNKNNFVGHRTFPIFTQCDYNKINYRRQLNGRSFVCDKLVPLP